MASERQDKDYTFIGDRSLTNRRASIDVPVAPGGTLADYVPCYFGRRSPMLYNIEIGYGDGMVKRPASKIVYLCFRGRILEANNLEWCYTDGHAKNKLTKFYVAENAPQHVDVNAIASKNWGFAAIKESDPDMKRRKQAELLIHNHIPAEAILYIFVADEAALTIVKQFVLSSQCEIRAGLPTDISDFYFNL